MCLELLNSLIGLSFAWLGLALMAALVAALAALYLMRARKKVPKSKPSPGFTCPCYTPPWPPPEKDRE